MVQNGARKLLVLLIGRLSKLNIEKDTNFMPFKKRGKYYYHGGRRYTAKQVKFYYASHGTFKYRRGRKRRR